MRRLTGYSGISCLDITGDLLFPLLSLAQPFVKLKRGFAPDEVFCFKYHCTVGTDNVVRFAGHRLQIMLTNSRLSYARARVEVQEKLDGSLAVYYQGHCLATKPAPPESPVLRVRKADRVITSVTNSEEPAAPVIPPTRTLRSKPDCHTRPAPDHPWRRPFKVHIDRG